MSVKVQLRVKTLGHKAGDVIEVDSSEIAQHMIANGHALGIDEAAKKLQLEILGTADAPILKPSPRKRTAAKPRARKAATPKPKG